MHMQTKPSQHPKQRFQYFHTPVHTTRPCPMPMRGWKSGTARGALQTKESRKVCNDDDIHPPALPESNDGIGKFTYSTGNSYVLLLRRSKE